MEQILLVSNATCGLLLVNFYLRDGNSKTSGRVPHFLVCFLWPSIGSVDGSAAGGLADAVLSVFG